MINEHDIRDMWADQSVAPEKPNNDFLLLSMTEILKRMPDDQFLEILRSALREKGGV